MLVLSDCQVRLRVSLRVLPALDSLVGGSCFAHSGAASGGNDGWLRVGFTTGFDGTLCQSCFGLV